MDRREFLKITGMSGAALAAGGISIGLPNQSEAAKKEDIGEIKSLKVTVLSETSWFNNDVFKKDMMDGGGTMANQYDIAWNKENSGGYSALLEIEQLNGSKMRNPEYTGHLIRKLLDTQSGFHWTLNPEMTGQ